MAIAGGLGSSGLSVKPLFIYFIGRTRYGSACQSVVLVTSARSPRCQWQAIRGKSTSGNMKIPGMKTQVRRSWVQIPLPQNNFSSEISRDHLTVEFVHFLSVRLIIVSCV